MLKPCFWMFLGQTKMQNQAERTSQSDPAEVWVEMAAISPQDDGDLTKEKRDLT